MKNRLLLVVALLCAGPLFRAAPFALAQAPGPALETLSIDLWPDYDQPSVLVLLTGQIAVGTPLPATITLPLPPDATLNAVARITTEGTLMADVAYQLAATGDSLMLTTPDDAFRVEYYMPYVPQDLERQFVFEWQAPAAVTRLLVTVQQPAAATGLLVTPAPVSVTPASNGLQLHNLPAASLAVGESYRVDVSYTMSGPMLSAALLAANAAPADAVPAQPAVAAGENWPLLIGGLILLLGLAVGGAFWFGRGSASRRPARSTASATRARKPAPRRAAPVPPARRQSGTQDATPAAKARFCHQCGQPVADGDRFCRVCGTPLKA